MVETQWDLQEVKYLKKMQLVQGNLLMLLVFVAFGYLVENGKPLLLFGTLVVLSWIIVTITLHNTIMTERPIGTKTSRRVWAFDRNRLGDKRWKRRKITEIIIICIINVFVTGFIFVMDFDTVRLDFPIDAIPFIGAWIGYNIGEIIRMNNL